jgi:hypothetical protein
MITATLALASLSLVSAGHHEYSNYWNNMWGGQYALQSWPSAYTGMNCGMGSLMMQTGFGGAGQYGIRSLSYPTSVYPNAFSQYSCNGIQNPMELGYGYLDQFNYQSSMTTYQVPYVGSVYPQGSYYHYDTNYPNQMMIRHPQYAEPWVYQRQNPYNNGYYNNYAYGGQNYNWNMNSIPGFGGGMGINRGGFWNGAEESALSVAAFAAAAIYPMLL